MKVKANGCVVKRSAQPADLEVDRFRTELVVKVKANGCVVKRSAQPADLEVAGDAEHTHIGVGCRSKRQRSLGSNAVTMVTLVTSLWASGGSGRAASSTPVGGAPRPRPTRRRSSTV